MGRMNFWPGINKKVIQPKPTFLPAEQEGNIWRYLCSMQTCDFGMLPDVTCAPGYLTKLGKKCGICCLSCTHGGPWANKGRLPHKSSVPVAAARGSWGAHRCFPQFVPIKQGARPVGWGEPHSKLASNSFPHPLPLGHGRKEHVRKQYK